MTETNTQVQSDFDAWLESQDEGVKTLISERFSKLENTIRATRKERDDFSVELKSISKKITQDTEAKTQIDELTNRLTKAEKKSQFIEKAITNGCKRPSAAYLIAETDKLYTEDGEPDWERIRTEIPELFSVVNTNNNAGNGANQRPVVNENKAFKDALSKGTVSVKAKL